MSDGTITITANGGTGALSYSIDGGSTYTNSTGIFSGLDAGSYSVMVHDSSSCTNVGSIITITEPAALIISIASTDVSCNGGSDGSAALSVSGGTLSYSYLWSDPGSQTSSTATGLTAGTYNVTVTDANGCIETDNVTINEISGGPQTSLIIGVANVIELATENYVVTLHTGSIYDWSVDNGAQVSGGQTYSIDIKWGATGSGKVSVVETDSFGCFGDTVSLDVNIGVSGMNKSGSSPGTVHIYPNPNKGIFTLEVSNFNLAGGDCILLISDVLGREILSSPVRNATSIIDISSYPAGFYELQVASGETSYFNKVLIK